MLERADTRTKIPYKRDVIADERGTIRYLQTTHSRYLSGISSINCVANLYNNTISINVILPMFETWLRMVVPSSKPP